MALTLASELDKEEPPCGRHASGSEVTLASELDADMLVTFRNIFTCYLRLDKIWYEEAKNGGM